MLTHQHGRSNRLICIGIRAPPFWAEKAAVWFAQLEGQFAVSNITQDTKKF